MVVLLNQNILHGELLSPRPPHDGFRYFYSLFIGQRDGQRECFPWSHGQITGEAPPGKGEIPHGAVALEWPCVVRDSALHGEATVRTKREKKRVSGTISRRVAGRRVLHLPIPHRFI